MSVKCADCGLLCSCQNGTFMLVEIPYEVRKDWASNGAENKFLASTSRVAMCAVMALPESDEGKRHKEAKVVIEKDRECLSFIQWKPGFSPKEHREMQLADEMRRFQEQRLDADRQRAAAEKQADKKARDEDKRIDQELQARQKKEDRSWQLKLKVFGGLFSLITGTIGLLIGKFMNPASNQPVIIQLRDGKKIEANQAAKGD